MWKPFPLACMISAGAVFLTALALLAGLFHAPDRALELWLARQGLVTTQSLSNPQAALYAYLVACLVGWFMLATSRLTLRFFLVILTAVCLLLIVPWAARSGQYLSPFAPAFASAITLFWAWIALQSFTARRYRSFASAFFNRVTRETWDRICRSNYDGADRTGQASLLTVLYQGKDEDRQSWFDSCRAQILRQGGVFMPTPDHSHLQAWFGVPWESLPANKNHAQAAAAAAHETLTRWSQPSPPALSLTTGPVSYGLFTLTKEMPILQITEEWSARGTRIARIAGDTSGGALADIPTYDASSSTFAYRPVGFQKLDAWGEEEIFALFAPAASLTDHQKDRLKLFWQAALTLRQGKTEIAAPMVRALLPGGESDELVARLSRALETSQ